MSAEFRDSASVIMSEESLRLRRRIHTDPVAYAIFKLAQRVVEINPESAGSEQCEKLALDFTRAAVDLIDATRTRVAAEIRGAIAAGTSPRWVHVLADVALVGEWAAQIAEGQR